MSATLRFTTACLLGLIAFSSCSESRSRRPQPEAVRGLLDLRAWMFEEHGPVQLKGEWRFHWKQLLTTLPEGRGKPAQGPLFVKAPGYWNDYSLEGRRLPGQGYGTYALEVLLPPGTNFALLVPDQGTSSFRVLVNGVSRAESGRVGASAAGSQPQMLARLVELPSTGGKIQLLLQMSEYHHRFGGMWQPPRLGLPEQLRSAQSGSREREIFLIGAILMMGLYHLTLFVLRRRDRSSLYFGIFCLITVIRTAVTGERVLLGAFPEWPFGLTHRAEYLTFFLAVPIFALFVHTVFPREIHRYAAWALLVVGALFSAVVLATHPLVYTQLTRPYQVVTLAGAVYVLVAMAVALKRKRTGAALFLVGILVLLTAVVNDILHNNQVITTGYFTSLGFLGFIFAQSAMLGKIFGRAFAQVEELSVNLERRVQERTHALEQARKESDDLLANILPAKIADELKREGHVEPLFYDDVSVLFTDFVGFTRAAEGMLPDQLVEELDSCFRQFDEIVGRRGLEKLKTIGDSYMCAAGLPVITWTHAVDACLAALEIRSSMEAIAAQKRTLGKEFWQIRIGIHSGPVTAGVIGTNKFAYDIWGDTVNTASRLESSGLAGEVNVSATTFQQVQDYFECEHRGRIEAKGKGELDMYFVRRIKPELSEDAAGLVPNAVFAERRARLAEPGS